MVMNKLNLRKEVRDLEFKDSKNKGFAVTETIAFKLSGQYLFDIKMIAKQYNISAGKFCKQLIVNYLDKKEDPRHKGGC
jgi:hypothetical protein